MRTRLFLGVLVISAAFLAILPLWAADRAQDVAEARVPVVVELFTSEGCSSCPPADRLLAELAKDQPVPGAEIIPLGFHVDYWNRLGWRDRFSSPEFTARQQRYGNVFRLRSVYTPQMVVDGRFELVGSEARKAARLIREAAESQKTPVELKTLAGGKQRVSLQVTIPEAPADARKAEVLLAITEDGLDSDVSRGENAGRRLSHHGVVRQLVRLGSLDGAGERAFHLETTVALKPEWDRDRLRAVVWIQERRGHRILGASAAELAL